MSEVSLDAALPAVCSLARRKAGALVHRCRYSPDERDDIESHLVLTFIRRWPKFDNERASLLTFASRIMDNELISVLRHRLAQSRNPCEMLIGASGPLPFVAHQFRIDLERALAPLSEAHHRIVIALSCGSAVEAAESLLCSRQTINIKRCEIRDALLASGIGPTYFTSGRAES